jgi:hypothetical protein
MWAIFTMDRITSQLSGGRKIISWFLDGQMENWKLRRRGVRNSTGRKSITTTQPKLLWMNQEESTSINKCQWNLSTTQPTVRGVFRTCGTQMTSKDHHRSTKSIQQSLRIHKILRASKDKRKTEERIVRCEPTTGACNGSSFQTASDWGMHNGCKSSRKQLMIH